MAFGVGPSQIEVGGPGKLKTVSRERTGREVSDPDPAERDCNGSGAGFRDIRAVSELSTGDFVGYLGAETMKQIGLPPSLSKATSPFQVTGKSGVKHTFTLGASENGATYLACDIIVGDGPVDETKVLSLFIKVYDVGARHAVLCAVPSLTADAKKLSALYKITTVEPGVRDEIPRMLSDVLQRFV